LCFKPSAPVHPKTLVSTGGGESLFQTNTHTQTHLGHVGSGRVAILTERGGSIGGMDPVVYVYRLYASLAPSGM
jgi:hypothetical protein